MKVLLDTHIFLWFISGDNQLSENLINTIRDSDNEIYLSVISIWEATIKYQLGKLPLPESPDLYLPKQRIRHRIDSLDLDEKSFTQLIKLPPLHRDPFDRALIAQALQKGLKFATVDKEIRKYSVETIR